MARANSVRRSRKHAYQKKGPHGRS